MNDLQLIAVIIGVVAGLAVIVEGLVRTSGKTSDALRAAFELLKPALDALRQQAEQTVVDSRVDLGELHNALMFFKGYIDEPDDTVIAFVARLFGLPREAVRRVALQLWAEAEDLTDGAVEPAQEHIPANKPVETAR